MTLNKLLCTKNNCYITARKLAPKGIMVHSTGANNPNLKRYVGPDDGKLGVNQYGNHWNQPRPDGLEICCHAFIGKLADGSIATYQILPWNYQGWHCGKGRNGSANSTHIGFEICEDGQSDGAYFQKVYREALEFCLYLCRMYDINPNNVIDHAEGWAKGLASNHGDVGYWFKRHGKSMDLFRAELRKLLAQPAPAAKPAATPPVLAKATNALKTNSPPSAQENFSVGARVSIKAEALNYYPASKAIPDWAKQKAYTVDALREMGGVPCARLKEIETYCALSALKKA